MSKVLLSSGGMDSFLLAMEPELSGAVHVFVDIGQKYVSKELRAAEYVANCAQAEFVVVRAAEIAQFEDKSGIIPFRNAELILCAAQYGQNIYLGVIGDEINSDKSPEFLNIMQEVLNISYRPQYWTEGKHFKIKTPFMHTSKTELVRRYIERGGLMHSLLTTVSCYDGGTQHCGRCASCFKRWIALTVATGSDYGTAPLFARHPATWQPIAHWKAKLGEYGVRRAQETKEAFRIAGYLL